MSLFASLLDPNQDLKIDQDVWAVGILRKRNEKDPEQTYLMIEGINNFGKTVLKCYGCRPDNSPENKVKVEIDEKIVDPQVAKQAYLDLLNNESILGKVWLISKQNAELLHQNVLASQKSPGRYNPLGDAAIAPKIADCLNELPPVIKDAIKEGALVSTEAVTGPRVAVAAKITTEFGNCITDAVNRTPDTIKEPVTNLFSGFLNKRVGSSAGEIIKNSSKPSGNNSFTWAKNMLSSIDDDLIKQELPRKAFDIIQSVTSRHLNDKSKEAGNQAKWIGRRS